MGRPIQPLEFAGQNLAVLGFIWLSSHLQHSHIWIAFTGVWGRLLISPAHHQLHHSADPAHFDRNFGAYLAIWDWLFGTLRVPQAHREPLTVGLGPDQAQHTVTGLLVTPVIAASKRLWRRPTYRIKSLAVRG
jgi:sterol desaturase/sphingolipid hydroxylase (fatty acid hydroxylase superfamily)